MTLAEQALELLKDTGNTPDEMYDFFLRQGIKGKRCDPALCPCGTYLQEKLGQTIFVFNMVISEKKYSLLEDNDTIKNRNEKIIVDTTDAIRLFVERFDAESYPELIEI